MSFDSTSLEGEIDAMVIDRWSLWQNEKQQPPCTGAGSQGERCLYSWARTKSRAGTEKNH